MGELIVFFVYDAVLKRNRMGKLEPHVLLNLFGGILCNSFTRKFSTKNRIDVVHTQNNCLNETVLLSTQNV